MREIKYRAKELIGDDWYYGSHLCLPHEKTIAWYERDGKNRYFLHHPSIDPDTVGQYTGFKDADEKEIYEGDVIKLGAWGIAEVLWREDLGCFTVKLCGDDEPSDEPISSWLKPRHAVKVIATIHDCPIIRPKQRHAHRID